MNRGIRDIKAPDQLVLMVHIDMILVAVVVPTVFLNPARLSVLFPEFVRCRYPVGRDFTAFDSCILLTAVALPRGRNNRGIDNLPLTCLIALMVKIAGRVLLVSETL